MNARALKAAAALLWCVVATTVLVSQQPSNKEQTPAALSPTSPMIHIGNGRLKMSGTESLVPINAEGGSLIVDGIWLPESNNPDDALAFPEQVKITCDETEKVCRESKVTLSGFGPMLTIVGPDETDWPIVSWDAHGLLASYGPNRATSGSDNCHSHVLTMSFGSGAVSTSDIPTHEKGCDMFRKTNSFRLARGGYWIDTSSGNDFLSGKAKR
jgi:hypothetical protein